MQRVEIGGSRLRPQRQDPLVGMPSLRKARPHRPLQAGKARRISAHRPRTPGPDRVRHRRAAGRAGQPVQGQGSGSRPVQADPARTFPCQGLPIRAINASCKLEGAG